MTWDDGTCTGICELKESWNLLVTSRICSVVDSVDPRHLSMSSLQSLMVILHGCCTPLYCTVLYCVLCPGRVESSAHTLYRLLLVLTWRKLGPGWAGPGWQQQAGQYGSVHTRTGDTSPVQPPASVETRQSYQQLHCFKQFNPSKPAKYGVIVSSEHV